MPDNYSWITQVAVETFDPVAVGTDWLDQWIHHVQLSLNESGSGYGGTGYRLDDTTRPFIELRATKDNQPVDTRLLLAPLADGLVIFLGGRDADPDQGACDAWIAASHDATASLGSPGQTFQWTALIGPPAPGTMTAIPHLAEQVTIGAVRLTPQPDPVYELGASTTNHSLSTFTHTCWWPILAEGGHTAYAWTAASKKAAFDLHRLCGLLSIALDVWAVVREAPAPLEWGTRKAPPRLSWQKALDFPVAHTPPALCVRVI